MRTHGQRTTECEDRARILKQNSQLMDLEEGWRFREVWNRGEGILFSPPNTNIQIYIFGLKISLKYEYPWSGMTQRKQLNIVLCSALSKYYK